MADHGSASVGEIAIPKSLRANEFLDKQGIQDVVNLARKVAPDMVERTTAGAGLRVSDIVMSGGQKYLGPYNPSRVSTKIKKKMELTPQVALAAATATSPLHTARFTLLHPDEKLRARVEQTVLEPLRVALINHYIDSVFFGHAVDEILWERGTQEWRYQQGEGIIKKTKSQFYIKELKDLDPQSYRFVANTLGNLVGITQKQVVRTSEDIIPMDKVSHYTHRAKYGNPWGQGRSETIYEVWYWHQVISLFCNQYFERRAIPPTVVYVDPNESLKDGTTGARSENTLQSVAQSFQRQLRGNVVLALWSVYDQVAGERIWDVKTLESDARGAMFIEYLTYLDTKIFRGFLVPERSATQDSSVGSNSMASTHAGLATDLANILLGGLLSVINDQILPRWAKANNVTGELKAGATNINKAAMALQADVIKKLLDVEQALLSGGKLLETRGLLTSMIDRANLCREAGLQVVEDQALAQFPEKVKKDDPPPAPAVTAIPTTGSKSGPDNKGDSKPAAKTKKED